MKGAIDISRPDLLFAVIWLAAVVLIRLLPVGFVVEPDPRIEGLILFNVISFYVVYKVTSAIYRRRRLPAPDVSDFLSQSGSRSDFRRYLTYMFWAWFPVYLLTVAVNGGLPLIWLLTGAGKTYTDFGVPTLSGLLNMIRAFMFVGFIALYLVDGRRRLLLVPALLLATSVAEVSRGGMLVLILHGVGVYLLLRSPSIRHVLNVIMLGLLFIIAFGVLGEFRGATLDPSEFVGEESRFVTMPLGFFFAFTYLVSPLNNLYFGFDSLTPLYYPFYSLQALVPTIVRDLLFPTVASVETRYPIALYLEAFNATSFYGPLLADFGLIGAALVTLLFQVVTSRVHVAARKGSFVHLLMYPALFMSIVLSVFYLFFLSMVVVLFPILCIGYRSFLASLARRRAVAAMTGSGPPAPT
jgi:oligosaccharide repeat unit polymerase